MKKNRAKGNFIFIAVLTFLALCLCVFTIPLPWSNYNFKGFANSMNLGLEFNGGVSGVYTIDKASYYNGSDGDLNTTALNTVQKLVNKTYGEGTVDFVGTDSIKITVPSTSISTDCLLQELEIKAASGETAETYLTGKHIKKAEYKMNGTSHGVYITFTKEGKTLFANVTSEASGNSGYIYMYLGKNYESSNEISIPISEEVTTGYAYITMANKDACMTYVNALNNSRIGITLSLDGDTTVVTATFNTLQKVILACAMVGLIIGSIIFLIVRYSQLGLVSGLAMLIFAILNVTIFSLVPQVVLTLSSYLGMAVGYILTFVCVLYTLERCRKDYASGKKLPASFKSGYIKSIGGIVDMYVLPLIACIVAFIATTGKLVSFATTLSINLAVGIVTTLLLLRGFMMMYISINPGKSNLIKFKREDNVNEIK